MAFLTPDKTYNWNGLTVYEKLITAKSGVKYYSNRKLNTKDNKPEYITIHNTPDINEAAGTNDAEQYARATFNNNMGDVVVHYYIDETACWHILADDTVGWHAADGANGTGNTKSIAIEIVMDGSGRDYDKKAEDRGAKLAAILLNKYGLGIDKMVTHQHWYPKKYCPAYIIPHWGTFVDKVQAYLSEIQKPAASPTPAPVVSDGKKYRVQVGYFGVKANAVKMQQRVKNAGFDAIIKTASDKAHWRVQVGYFSVKANAEELVKKLNKAGFAAIILEE